MTNITICGIDSAELALVLKTEVDHGGNAIESFVDENGGMPMRCCLADSKPGDHVAINKMIAYHRVRHIPAGESLTAHVEELLAFEDVDFLHGRNVTGGCFSFAAATKAR